MESESSTGKHGRSLIAIIFVVTLGFSGGTLVTAIAGNAEAKVLILRGSRFALTVVLCIGLYSGRNWARLVMGFFSVMGTLAAIAMAARAGWTSPRAMISIILAALFAPIALILLRSQSIREFIDDRRKALSP